VAIVTGGSRGIGRATAQLLAAEGARVAITFRRDSQRAQAILASIRERGGDACVVPLDLTVADSIRDAVNQVLDRWGRVDVLINNAVEWVRVSGQNPAAFEAVEPGSWQRPLRANIEGAYTATQAVVPSMRARQWGRIVNISSIAATDGMPGFSWYSASKAALHGLTRTLARELGPSGILVNVVMPGGTLTSSVFEQVPAFTLKLQARQLPIGRLPRPEEVAATIVFLASAANTTVTGEIVRSSGGRPY
jgi:3-oxoacyl-[acyl-carrier protein] reductase